MSKVAIITGAAGFIGSSFVRKLINNNYVVYAVDVNSLVLEKRFGVPCDNLKFITANFSEYPRLHDILPVNADVFVHFAWAGGLTSALSDYLIQLDNVKYACVAAEEAAKLNSKLFVFISSNYQFMELNNNSELNPSLYGIAKKTAQDMCQDILSNTSTKFIAAILGNTYGRGDYSNKSVNTFVRKMLMNCDLKLILGDEKNDWMYIDETVNGLTAVIENKIMQDKVYIGHEDVSLFRDKLLQLKKILNSNSLLLFGEYPENSHVNYDKVKGICIEQSYLQSESFESYILKTKQWIEFIDKD